MPGGGVMLLVGVDPLWDIPCGVGMLVVDGELPDGKDIPDGGVMLEVVGVELPEGNGIPAGGVMPVFMELDEGVGIP